MLLPPFAAVVQCVSIVVVGIAAEIALAAVSAAAAVDDLVIVAAAVAIVCIVVVVVVDTGGAAVGAATATATCAVTYARLWFDSYGGRHVVVSIEEIVRSGRSGGENPAAAVRRSVQRRPQLDRRMRDGFIDFRRDVQRFHRVAGTRIGIGISTVYGTG